MATNYTTNYDLCQWEPTDPVQRVEFNSDNAKADAALAGHAALLAKCGNCQPTKSPKINAINIKVVNLTFFITLFLSVNYTIKTSLFKFPADPRLIKNKFFIKDIYQEYRCNIYFY